MIYPRIALVALTPGDTAKTCYDTSRGEGCTRFGHSRHLYLIILNQIAVYSFHNILSQISVYSFSNISCQISTQHFLYKHHDKWWFSYYHRCMCLPSNALRAISTNNFVFRFPYLRCPLKCFSTLYSWFWFRDCSWHVWQLSTQTCKCVIVM